LEPWKRTLYILFATQLVSAVGFAVFFPFLPLYINELGTNTSLSLEFWSGMVYAGQALTMAITSPIWGSLADRFGRKAMVERALYGGAVIILLMGFARSAEELALLRAIQGAVTGTISATNALVAAAAPRERTGYAMGLLQVGLWGGVAFGPLLGGLIADTLGFRAAFVVTAVLLVISGVVVTIGIREEFTPPPTGQRRPGILADWRRILGRPSVALAYLVRFLNQLGPNMLLPVLPLFVSEILHGSGRISTFTGLVVGVSSATGTATALYLGRLGDRAGHRRVLIIATAAAALFYAPQFFVSEGWQLLVLQALTGAATGGMGPAISALLARYTPEGEEGVVYGLDNSVAAAARAAAPLVGAALAVWLGVAGIFVVVALVLLASAALVLRFLPERPRATASATESEEKRDSRERPA
jgi:DHA1 family multidrug resistance protein-like MFS transporter